MDVNTFKQMLSDWQKVSHKHPLPWVYMNLTESGLISKRRSIRHCICYVVDSGVCYRGVVCFENVVSVGENNMRDTSKLIPFDIDLYKQGYKAVCRDEGFEVRHVTEAKHPNPPLVVTIVAKDGDMFVRGYDKMDGTYYKGCYNGSILDLFLIPKEKWINLWLDTDGNIISNSSTLQYDTEEEANEAAGKCIVDTLKYVGAVKLPL